MDIAGAGKLRQPARILIYGVRVCTVRARVATIFHLLTCPSVSICCHASEDNINSGLALCTYTWAADCD